MAKTAKKRLSQKDRQARLWSFVWHALKYIAGKGANEAARDLLTAGESMPVRLTITGTVGDQAVEEHFSGNVDVAHDETTSKPVTPDQNHLVALLLETMPKTRSDELLATLPKTYTETGALPEVSDEKLKQAKALLEQLRSRTPATRKGAVRYQLVAATD